MADKENSGLLGAQKAAFKNNPKAGKAVIMFGAIGVVVMGISFAMYKKGSSDPKAAGVPATAQLQSLNGAQGTNDPLKPVTAEYQAMVKEQEAKRLAEASKTPGQTVIPSIAGLTNVNTKPAEKEKEKEQKEQPRVEQQAAQQSVQRQVPQNYGVAVDQGPLQGRRVVSPEEAARLSPAYQSVLKLLADQVTKALKPTETAWAPVVAQQAAGTQATAVAQQAAQAATAAAATAAAGVTAAPQPVLPLIRMGTTLFATLDTAINTDYSGPVVATIRQGKYSGARLVGTKTLEHDAVVIKFTQMAVEGVDSALAVNAYAVTTSDARNFGSTGLEGNTDRHVFDRYILPAAVSFVTAFGQMAAQPSQTTTMNGSGSAIQSTTPAEGRARLLGAAGQAAQPLVSDVAKKAARPITISIDSGAEIGVLFAGDVVASTPRNVASATEEPAQAPAAAAAPVSRAAADAMAQAAALRQQSQQLQQAKAGVVVPNAGNPYGPTVNSYNPYGQNYNPYGQTYNPYGQAGAANTGATGYR